MKLLTATTRCVVAASTAVVLALPAAAPAADGSAGSNQGGGATFYGSAPSNGEISIRVASGAWVGRATRIRGRSAELAGQEIAIERRRSRRQGWVPVRSVRVSDGGTFSARWKPERAGRHELRAVSAAASSAGSREARASSDSARVTVFRKVKVTWYGPGFYGNRTACGQRLTRSTQGVAHKTLPCGTKVSLRANGRTVTVPVIDRGPYANGAVYDLAGATAKRLGVTYTSHIGAAVLSR